jgi:3,4-dihydroxy 2-butanone 4-phosphate synthase/GTP cyclohydrolase II
MLKESRSAALVYLSYPSTQAAFPDFKDISNAPQTDDQKSVGMDSRILGIGAQIIRSLGIQRMRTHVTQPRTLKGLAGFGLEVVDNVLIQTHS